MQSSRPLGKSRAYDPVQLDGTNGEASGAIEVAELCGFSRHHCVRHCPLPPASTQRVQNAGYK